MSITRILGVLVVAVLLGYAIHRARDPLRTALPFGTTDLSSVESVTWNPKSVVFADGTRLDSGP